MSKKRIGAKSCGVAGKTARAVARKLLDNFPVSKREAREAFDHINQCGFCRLRIKNQIADAKKGMKQQAYLGSLPETLRRLQKLVS